MQFEKRINQLKIRFSELETKFSDPATVSDQAKYREITKEYSGAKKILELYGELEKVEKGIIDSEEILKDKDLDMEFKEMAESEKIELIEKRTKLEKQLRLSFIPQDKRDAKNTIVEIRAGTGGDEAALFVSELFRMYRRYAERRGWKLELMDSNPTGLGGFKEIVFSLEGDDIYRTMKYESGTHRVQRVPETEACGRIHTSAATVAVLAEADEVDLHIDAKDLRIDVCRSSGPGGQNVNKVESAIRITHIPTGVVVQCQDGRSQLQNKVQAMKVLRSRLLAAKEEAQRKEREEARREQVGSGDRSEKIRTYNYPQNRLTDHRIGVTLYRLESLLDGDIQELIDALMEAQYVKELADLS